MMNSMDDQLYRTNKKNINMIIIKLCPMHGAGYHGSLYSCTIPLDLDFPCVAMMSYCQAFVSVFPPLCFPSGSVAAGTQYKMVLGKQKFVSEANKFLPQTSWGVGGAVSPLLGFRGKAPGKL